MLLRGALRSSIAQNLDETQHLGAAVANRREFSHRAKAAAALACSPPLLPAASPGMSGIQHFSGELPLLRENAIQGLPQHFFFQQAENLLCASIPTRYA